MGKYSGAFEEAEKEFDEEFAGKLVESDFSEEALTDLTPEGGPDKEAMAQFIKKAKAASDAKAAKEAWLELGGKVSVVLLKAARKAITSGLMLILLFVGQAAAQPTAGGIPDAPPRPIAVPGQPQPSGTFSDFVKGQQYVAGFAFSPLDVNALDTRPVVFVKGFGFGDKGISLLFGTHNPEAKTYFDIDFGGSFKKGEERAEIILNLHVATITHGLVSRLPFADRLRLPYLPENLVGGPQFRLPLPGEKQGWTWRNGFRLVVAWLFG